MSGKFFSSPVLPEGPFDADCVVLHPQTIIMAGSDGEPLLQEPRAVVTTDEENPTITVHEPAITTKPHIITPLLAEFWGTALLTATVAFSSSSPGLSGV